MASCKYGLFSSSSMSISCISGDTGGDVHWLLLYFRLKEIGDLMIYVCWSYVDIAGHIDMFDLYVECGGLVGSSGYIKSCKGCCSMGTCGR